MFSAVNNSPDGKHYPLYLILEWFHVILNEWARVDERGLALVARLTAHKAQHVVEVAQG